MGGVTVGPWGGNGGVRFDDAADFDGIREITIVTGDCVDSITVVYDKNGVPEAEGKHGGDGGINKTEIKLDFPDEYIVGVSGHYDTPQSQATPVVVSLTFITNTRTLGPYGHEHGTPFSVPIENGRVVSFTGRSGTLLDAIGFRIASI